MKSKFIKYSRRIHRYLSYFFGGVIIIYAVSGIAMNHRKDFNPTYTISQKEYQSEGVFPRQKDSYSEEEIVKLLTTVEEKDNYKKHYYPNQSTMKVFLQDGSSLTLDLISGKSRYESLKKRPVLSQFISLHKDTAKWWVLFSDIFAISLLVITVTGIVMVKGKKGFIGIGGILFLLGILVPILFLLLT